MMARDAVFSFRADWRGVWGGPSDGMLGSEYYPRCVQSCKLYYPLKAANNDGSRYGIKACVSQFYEPH